MNKRNSMLKDSDYYKISEEYQTSVGIATHISFGDATKQRIPKSLSEDLDLTAIINHAISIGVYQQMIRKVRELDRKRGVRRIKDITLYKKAFELCKGN